MMQVCKKTNMTHRALKYCCNEGLAPDVKRDKIDRRVPDEREVKWSKDLAGLQNCAEHRPQIFSKLPI